MTGPAGDTVRRVLPKGPHNLDRDTVLTSQRVRMLEVVLSLVDEKGYQAVSVADIIAQAKVSRRTFYEHFRNKSDCFSVAFNEEAQLVIKKIIEATIANTSHETWIEAGPRALCVALAERPVFARIFLVLAPQADKKIQEKREQYLNSASETLREIVAQGRKNRPDLPAELSIYSAQAVVGAVTRLLATYLEEHGAEQLPNLAPIMLALVQALLLAKVPS
ncbi:MAG: TetR/AcrR family transcriptional regulator [Mycobacteriaceae bacterium]